MWEKCYKPEILMKEFYPYLIYLAMLILMTSVEQVNFLNFIRIYDNDTGETVREEHEDIMTYIWIQHGLNSLTALMILKYLYREVVQLKYLGITGYINEPWNVFDMITILLNGTYLSQLIYIAFIHQNGISEQYRMLIRTEGAFAMFFMWTKCFYWAKLFDNPAYFVTQLYATMQAVTGFMQILIIVIFAFSNFFYIIQHNLDPESEDRYVNQYT